MRSPSVTWMPCSASALHQVGPRRVSGAAVQIGITSEHLVDAVLEIGATEVMVALDVVVPVLLVPVGARAVVSVPDAVDSVTSSTHPEIGAAAGDALPVSRVCREADIYVESISGGIGRQRQGPRCVWACRSLAFTRLGPLGLAARPTRTRAGRCSVACPSWSCRARCTAHLAASAPASAPRRPSEPASGSPCCFLAVRLPTACHSARHLPTNPTLLRHSPRPPSRMPRRTPIPTKSGQTTRSPCTPFFLRGGRVVWPVSEQKSPCAAGLYGGSGV